MSRELDEKVARVVMGLTRHDESYDSTSEGREVRIGRYVWRDSTGKCIYTGDRFLPEYSADIAAAWQVVDRMRELGWDWIVSQDKDDKLATAEFQHRDGRIGFAQHESVSEAICQAALAALEAK